jgi:hypothetical protein
MARSPWHDAHTCEYTWCPRRTAAASYVVKYPSKSHGIGVGASTPSDAKTAELYTAAAVATPVPATAPSARGRDTRAALAASLARSLERSITLAAAM